QGPVVHPGPVIVKIELSQGLPVRGNEFGRQVGLRVLQAFKGRHFPEGPPRGQKETERHREHSGAEQDPAPFDEFEIIVGLFASLLNGFCHEQFGTLSISEPRSVMPSNVDRPCTSPLLRMAWETVTLYTPESGKTIFSRYHNLFSTIPP